jgi:hypothetical protein
MARHTFGKSLTDWSMILGDPIVVGDTTTAPVSVVGPVTITFWSASTGGVQYTDLLDSAANPAAEITASDGTDGLPIGTIPEFQGPDGDPYGPAEMWADAGAGTRYKMTANDLGGSVTELQSTAADLTDTTTALNTMVLASLGVVSYDAGASAWPQRPTADPRVFAWLGPSAPPAGTPYMEDGDLWINTSPA